MWVHHMSQVSHLLTVFSCSVNFYIYLAKHGQWKWIAARLDTDVSVFIDDKISEYLLKNVFFYRVFHGQNQELVL